MPLESIDYRSPGVGAHRVQAVAEMLARGEAIGMAAAWGKLAAGTVLTLVGPFLVSVIVRGVMYKRRWDVAPPFAATFTLVCLVVVPLLMWYERYTRGRFLEDEFSGGIGYTRPSSYGEYEMQKMRFSYLMYVETALLGPRLLWHVYDWARGTPTVHQPVRVLAAEMTVELLDAGEGLPVKRLVHSDRTPGQVHWALRYLESRDWVGVSKARDRAWLCTPVREKLANALRGSGVAAARADDR